MYLSCPYHGKCFTLVHGKCFTLVLEKKTNYPHPLVDHPVIKHGNDTTPIRNVHEFSQRTWSCPSHLELSSGKKNRIIADLNGTFSQPEPSRTLGDSHFFRGFSMWTIQPWAIPRWLPVITSQALSDLGTAKARPLAARTIFIQDFRKGRFHGQKVGSSPGGMGI